VFFFTFTTNQQSLAVPEIVANRMISRIVFFFGIPVFGGLFMFVAAYFISKNYDMVIQPSIVAYATQVPFILGLIGISYAILSSSWDEVSRNYRNEDDNS
jgi:membrane-bound acyltransferase YfiQ involved in biofilm formation